MQGEQMISALIGLVGAVSNNGRTEHTDGDPQGLFTDSKWWK